MSRSEAVKDTVSKEVSIVNDLVIISHGSWSGFCQEDANITAFGRKQSPEAVALNTNTTAFLRQQGWHSRSRSKSTGFRLSSEEIFNLKKKERAEMSRKCLLIMIGRKTGATSAWEM